MPLIPDQNPVLSEVHNFAETVDPSMAETIGAAGRLENSMVGLMTSEPLPEHEPVEGYNPLADIEGYEDQRSNFLYDTNPNVVAWRKRKIDQERKDRALIDSAGWPGVAAAVATGTMDPLFLPFVFAKGAQAGKPLVSAGRFAQQGAIGATVAEGVLGSQQETRSELESAFAITAGTLLAGALGGAAGALSRSEYDELVRQIDGDFNGTLDIERSVGAASAVDPTGSKLVGDRRNKIGGLSPLGQNMTSNSMAAREATESLVENGFLFQKNVDGVRKLQSVETLVKRWQAPRALAVQNTNDLYANYLGSTGKLDKATKSVKARFSDDVLSFTQFRDEIGKAMRRGDEHAIPEVAQAAKHYRAKVMDPIKDDLIKMGLLDEGDEVVGAMSYLSRVYDTVRLRQDPQPFKNELTSYFMEQQPELSRAEAIDIAENTVRNILGHNHGQIPVKIVGKAGATKARVLTIPDERIEGYLLSDIDQISDSYVHSLAPRIELKRRFGTEDMADEFQAINDDYDELLRKNPSKAKELNAERERSLKNLEVLRDRLLGTYGVPHDPMSFGVRAARILRELNFLRLLGGMTISAIPDVARPGMVAGFKPYGKVLGNLAKAPKATGMLMRDVKMFGTALDMVNSTRARAIAGTEDFLPLTGFERGLKRMSNNFGKVSLMNQWNTVFKQLAALTSQHEILRIANRSARGTATKKELQRLAQVGIDADDAAEIAEQFSKHGLSQDGLNVSESWTWDNAHAKERFETALLQQVDTAIVTPGIGDQPHFDLIGGGEVAKMLLQFRSFAFAAHNRMLMSSLQANDLRAYSGLLLSMALGAMTYGTKQALAGRDIDTSPANLLAESLDRSGMMGWLAEANGLAEKATGGLVGLKPQLSMLTGEEMQGMSRFASRNAIGALAGPSFDAVGDMLSITSSIGRGEFSESDLRALRKMMPYQNLFWLRNYINEVEESIGDEL